MADTTTIATQGHFGTISSAITAIATQGHFLEFFEDGVLGAFFLLSFNTDDRTSDFNADNRTSDLNADDRIGDLR
jgi:hypothetical protein